jgi:threonine synthase
MIMGITIRSKNHNIDIGTGGLLRLRKTIASLTNKEILDHYNILLSEEYIHMVYHGFEEYDKKTEELYEKYKKDSGDATPMVIVSTASPFKFTRSVMEAVEGAIDDKTDFELIDKLSKIANVKVPNAIEEIRNAEIMHDTVCDKEDMKAQVKKFLNL